MDVVDSVSSPVVWPEPDILNPWLDFFASAIGSLAWPAFVILLALLFREPVTKLIGRMKSVEAGGAKAEFGVEVADLAANAKKIETADPAVAQENDPRLQELLKMATASPTGAIVEAWKDVETAARLLVERSELFISVSETHTWKHDVRRKYILNTSRLLGKYGLLPPAEMSTYEELRTLRNKAAHESDQVVTPLSAAQYVRVADKLVDVITEYANQLAQDPSAAV